MLVKNRCFCSVVAGIILFFHSFALIPYLQDIEKMKTQKEKDAAEAFDRRTEFRVLSFQYKPKEENK